MIFVSSTSLFSSVPLTRSPICVLPSASNTSHILPPSLLPVCPSPVVARIDGPNLGIQPKICFPNDGGANLKEWNSVEDKGNDRGRGDERVTWDDLILEATTPLVYFSRMIIHSKKYKSGDRLTPEHEKVIREKLLPYHPCYKMKIGCGIDYITVGNHPDFERSRCLFIVRTNNEMIDFSFWKCVKGMIWANYPQYAAAFIIKHFE